MSLFTLLKISRTRYMVGKTHVRPGTPGAVKTIEESRHWYAYRRDGKTQIKVRLFTDKRASEAQLARMNLALERGEAKLTDPVQGAPRRAGGEAPGGFPARHAGEREVREGQGPQGGDP